MELYIAELKANSEKAVDPSDRNCFEIRTCQRTVILSHRPFELSTSNRSFEGAEAYEYLLRFASGLESEIKGETDVFGQVKTAIKNLSEVNPELSDSFRALFLKLFEDTKEIRAQYLHGIGGNTYGALARRLLNPKASDKVLMIGAGQISKSVAPYFAEAELCIYNRSEPRLSELKIELEKKGYSQFCTETSESALDSEIKTASIILIATPVGSDLDHKVIALAAADCLILHLGGQANEMSHFKNNNRNIFSLSDLFALEKGQNEIRERQIKQAMDACHSRAILRSLAASIHIPHGWEDLALFY